jgi:hypothetical protein
MYLNRPIARLLALPGLCGLLLAGAAAAQAVAPMDSNHEMNGGDLKSGMRKLWEDHITWTRLYLVSAAANLPEKDATAKRLLRNQEEIGRAIKPFYGDAAEDKLTGLLKGHIMIAVDLIDAAMKGDNANKDAAAGRWTTNADSIASFLSSANPTNWPLETMKGMMHSHLDLTTREVVAHLTKNWEDDVEAYDKVHEQILMMADALTAGITKQYPNKVKKP